MIFLKQKVLVSRIKIKRKSEQLKIKRKVWNIGCPKDKAPLLVSIVCNENGPRKRWFWFSFIVPNENKTKKETDSVTDDRTTSIRDGSQIRAERPRHRRALGTTSIAVHRSSPIAEYGPKTQTIWLLDFETTSITTVYKITVERVSFEKDINAGCDKGDDVVGTMIGIGTTMLSRMRSSCAPPICRSTRISPTRAERR